MGYSTRHTTFRTPRAGVRGLGADHGRAVRHFVGQRVSAIAAVPLSVVVGYLAYMGFLAPYDEAAALVRRPLFAVGIISFVLVVLYHTGLGMRMVVTDYVHKPLCRLVVLLAGFLFLGFLGVTMLYSVGVIAFGVSLPW